MSQITKIVHIDTDAGKCILISYRGVINMPKQKPAYSVDSFADFYPENNRLTTFSYNSSKPYYFDSFKSALKFLLALGK